MQMIRQTTAVLAVTANGEYLQFPEGWDVWHTENHWSNEDSMKRYIKKVIIPFVKQKREALKLEATHPALALFDGFKCQTIEMIQVFLTL